MAPVTADDALSSLLSIQQNGQQLVATYALNNALGYIQSQQFDKAVPELKRAIAYDPSNAATAQGYLGNTYLQMGNTKDAISVFQQMIRNNPGSSDAYQSLGNAYLQANQQSDAERTFKTMMNVDPQSTYSYYTLGQMYTQQGRFSEAETMFKKVVSLDRSDAHGYYGLGQLYNKMGRYDDAVSELKQATSLKKNFAEAIDELGEAYGKLGQQDDAQAQLDQLKTLNSPYATTLKADITQPRIIAGYSMDFAYTLGGGTHISALDTSLSNPGSQKVFSMVFQFDSAMDVNSVQNVMNWTIGKASGGAAGLYNNGITLNPSAETSVSAIPQNVMYDSTKMQATVFFALSQNSTGDAVIDPSHLVFKFNGTSITGKKIDPTANEFDGFASHPF